LSSTTKGAYPSATRSLEQTQEDKKTGDAQQSSDLLYSELTISGIKGLSLSNPDFKERIG
jgi:hypothetical protein